MTPESSDGRERITRLEGRVADIAQDVERNERTFGPLPLAVERLQWTIDAINSRLDKREREDEERLEKLTRSFENQIITCKTAVDEVARAQKDWIDSERRRRDDEQKVEKDDKSSDRTSRRAMWGLIGAAAITGVLGLGAQLIQMLGG